MDTNVWFCLVKPTILCQNSTKPLKKPNKTNDLHENVWFCSVKPTFWCKTTKNFQKSKKNKKKKTKFPDFGGVGGSPGLVSETLVFLVFFVFWRFFAVLHQNIGFTKQNHTFSCKSLVLFGFLKVFCYFGTESLVLLSKTIHCHTNRWFY